MDFSQLQKIDNLDFRIPEWLPFPQEKRICPFCNEYAEPLFLRPDNLPVSQCSQCRCFYVSLKLDNSALNSFYDNYWGITCPRPLTDEMARYLKASACNRFARDYCLTKLTALTGSLRDKRVLDIGCGFGEKASMIRSQGASVLGTDISLAAVNFCNDKLGIETRCASIENLQKEDNTFDIVTMFEFIEHPIDPLKALNVAVDRMKMGAFLVIVTPNGTAGERWWYPRESEWIGFRVDLEHMQYLHVDTIDYLCHRLNCRPVHLEQMGHRALDDITTVPQTDVVPGISSLVKKSVKSLPGVRRVVYAFRNFQANLQKFSQSTINTGDYHLFAILQKK